MPDESLIERPPLPAAITETGIIAIVRAPSTRQVGSAVEQLLAAGIRCVEIALTTPGAIPEIATLTAAFGADACIGAGTVLGAAPARDCIAAGAQFLVAPNAVAGMVKAGAESGVPCLLGALTPSEIIAAWNLGAAAVKVFPASLGGPRYLRDVRAPLPDIPLIPTGGISIDDVPDYLSAGAIAVGLGSPLLGDALEGGDLDSLGRRARRLIMAVRVAHEGGPV